MYVEFLWGGSKDEQKRVDEKEVTKATDQEFSAMLHSSNMTNFTELLMNVSTNNDSNGAIQPAFGAQISEPLFMRVIRLTIYLIIFLIAVFGNTLVIFVVYKTRELHTGKQIPKIITHCALKRASNYLDFLIFFFKYFYRWKISGTFNNCFFGMARQWEK